MEIFNQLAAPLAQSATVTRQQTTDKAQQILRSQATKRNVAATASDTFEHTVESAEEIKPIHDEQKQQQGRWTKRRAGKPAKSDDDDEAPRIDITA
jgi:hypothetical protein